MDYTNQRGVFISVHIGDIHFAAFDPAEQYRILHEQFVNLISTYPRIDLISINGDLFDHKLMANSPGIYYASLLVDELVQLCRMKNSTLILLHGTYSHDAGQLKLFLHYMNDKTVDVRVVNTIQFELVKNCRVLCIPELYGVEEDIYQEYLFRSGYYDLAVIHGTFEGSVYGNNVGNGRLFTMHDFCMCTGVMIGAHVHHPGCFGGYFYYSGNPYRWKFGEEEDKGFLVLLQDLDTNRHEVYFNKINSYTYITIDLKDIVANNPKDTIAYIDNLKKERGIDYLKIRFKYSIQGSDKVIINNYYRNNKTTFVEFLDIMEEQKLKAESEGKVDNDYAFIFDDSISDLEKFVHYVNMEEGSEFITIDRLKEILEETI
jgi:DNA repair exonuclease SbcCD nuclease subunit